MTLQTPPQTVSKAEEALGFSLQVVEGIYQEIDGTHIFLREPVRHQPVVVRVLSSYEILLKDSDLDGRTVYLHQKFGFTTIDPGVLAVDLKTEADWFPVPPTHFDATEFLESYRRGLPQMPNQLPGINFTPVKYWHRPA